MAKCESCKLDMSDESTHSCIVNNWKLGDKTYPAIPYQSDSEHRCHDCNVMPGGYHHPGCDMDRCPKCGGQLISCDC